MNASRSTRHWLPRSRCTSSCSAWGLVSFSSKAFEMPPEESVPVDIISADQLAKVMAGMKTGKKENPKPLVEKVAEAKPGRGCRRQDHREGAGGDRNRAAAAAEGRGKAGREKARSAEGGRGQAEGRTEAGREEAGSAQGRSDRGSHEEGREEAAAEAASRPPSRREPQSRRRSAPSTRRRSQPCSTSAIRRGRRSTGETLNSNAALGLAKGKAADNSATWGALFKSQVDRCWKKPYGGIEKPEAGWWSSPSS